MRYVEIYADPEGVSHFRDTKVDFPSPELPPGASPIIDSGFAQTMAGFISVPSGWDSGWHNSPGDGYAILLHGVVEIEVGTGEVRRFTTGGIWRSTDVLGRGHISRVVSDEDAVVYMATFNDSENNR